MVRRLERSFLLLPRPDAGEPYVDLFVVDPGIERCLGLEACREMRSLLREQPELRGEPRVQARYRRCPPQPEERVKTRRELCLEIRSEALLRAQRIGDPKERGRALRAVEICPPENGPATPSP